MGAVNVSVQNCLTRSRGKGRRHILQEELFFLLNWSANKLEKVLMSLRENYVNIKINGIQDLVILFVFI
jgi:hypothetical protein